MTSDGYGSYGGAMSDNGPSAPRGGVSPRIGPIQTVVPAAAVAVAGAPAPVFPTFRYQGGAVVANPQVYVSFWGDGWTDGALKARADRLTQFMKDLIVSKFVNVLHQYGVGPGVYKGTSFVTDNVTADLKQADFVSILQQTIDDNTIPEPVGQQTCVMIFLKDGISVHDGNIVMCAAEHDVAFGFHKYMTTRQGNLLWFAVIPALGSDCVKASCPAGDGSCPLKLTATQESRITQIASHEYAEITTDPHLDAWIDSDLNVGEIGDITNGNAAQIVVEGRAWTVQLIYSKFHDTGRPGAFYGLAMADRPVPLLPDAPRAATASRPAPARPLG